jgi:ribosomal protein S12 methylthiotransferase
LSGGEVVPGEMRRVRITQASDYDLVGDVVDAVQTPKKRRVGLRVVR